MNKNEFNREMENTIKNQTEIRVLTELKNSIQSFSTILVKQKKESVNVKTDHLKLFSWNTKNKKRMKRSEESR